MQRSGLKAVLSHCPLCRKVSRRWFIFYMGQLLQHRQTCSYSDLESYCAVLSIKMVIDGV